ncbi:MAG: FAD-binding oxidoreductase [Synechococcales bacterium]|nr:FAD-binding oxidoreductase [Synechococcales bacterium]
MKYDWIVVGNGITGAAASYELAKAGAAVLLLDRHQQNQGATRYSYGGIAYWSGTTPLLQQLCQEGLERHRHLSDELGASTQFRELDLILTLPVDGDPDAIAAAYANCEIPPQRLTPQEAEELEPLLNPQAIAGALTVKHGHVDPVCFLQAYNQAFQHRGGVRRVAAVTDLWQQGDRVQGVMTEMGAIAAGNVLICAGGLSRDLLYRAGLPISQFFTHAELIEISSQETSGCQALRSLVMPADLKRFSLEAAASRPEAALAWQESGQEVVPSILDAGAIQFQTGRLILGQVSRALSDPFASVDAGRSEASIRDGVSKILPSLGYLPGRWHHCLVAFSGDRLPLIGPVPGVEGVHLFSGFGNPFAILPSLAARFATHVTQEPDRIISQLNPNRPSLRNCP